MMTPPASAAHPTRSLARATAVDTPADDTFVRRCTLVALLLAAAVVALGAYVRLNDAGLACPDWPGCYGRIAVPLSAPDPFRAQLEMTHRYLAGSLGLLISAVFVMTVLRRRPALLPTLLLATVIVQALLGRWTVTGLLQPAVVTAHLLGGFTTLSLLGWLALRLHRLPCIPASSALRVLAALALCAAAGQVMLGGWTSANHAALACDGFPQCLNQWWPAGDYRAGFTLSRPPPGEQADAAARVAIHWSHRLGALTLAALLLGLSLALWRRRHPLALLLLVLLATQLTLGATVVLWQRPLLPATAHSFCAALLVLCLVAVNATLSRRGRT